jgi:hypothetical protein
VGGSGRVGADLVGSGQIPGTAGSDRFPNAPTQLAKSGRIWTVPGGSGRICADPADLEVSGQIRRIPVVCNGSAQIRPCLSGSGRVRAGPGRSGQIRQDLVHLMWSERIRPDPPRFGRIRAGPGGSTQIWPDLARSGGFEITRTNLAVSRSPEQIWPGLAGSERTRADLTRPEQIYRI